MSSWVSGDSSHKTTVQDSFDWLSMSLSLVLWESFVLYLAIKRESILVLRNICTRYIGGIYVTVSGRCILDKNLSKIINFLVWKSTHLNWSVLILFILELWMEDVSHLSKWKKNLFTLEKMCEKTKKHELRKKFPKIPKTQIAKTYLAKHIISAEL